MTLAEISKAHENALEVARRGVTVRPVANTDIHAFDVARRAFQTSVDKLQEAAPLKKFATLCSQLHALICRTPCRPSWLFETFTPQFRELQPKLKPVLAAADQKLQLNFRKVCDRLAVVQKIEINPLANEVGELLTRSEEACERSIVVIPQPALWSEVRATLDPGKQRKLMVIMKPSELRRASPVDRLILFGPPWLFDYRGELFLFRSPVAGNVDLFVFRHDSHGKISASALQEETLTFNGIESKPIQTEDLKNEPILIFHPGSFVPRAFHQSPYEQPNAQAVYVRAWPVNLGGNKGTYLDPEGTVFALECAHDGERAVCRRVEHRDVEELELGDLIVLTTEGGGDLVRPLADEILGDRAHGYRRHQAEWKRRLRERVDPDGMPSVVAQLRTLGSVSANPVNLRNWMSDRNIGPNNLSADFTAILALVSLAEAQNEYCEAIAAIRGAHKSAGFQLAGRLREALNGMDVRKAFIEGLLEVRTEHDGPAKTIFLVEQIDRDSVSVPSHAVSRVFDLEEPQ